MKNCNRRSFIQVFAAAAATIVLLPRKAIGQALGLPSAEVAKAKAADSSDFSAAAALIKKAPHSVAHAPRAARRSLNT